MSEKNAETARETYAAWHTITLIEEYLERAQPKDVEQILKDELAKRGVNEQQISEFIAFHKLNEFPTGLDYSNLALREDRVMAQIIDQFYGIVFIGFLTLLAWLVGALTAYTAYFLVTIYFAYVLFNDALPNGQSLGKYSLNIKVVSSKDAKNCNIVQSFLRNFITLIPLINIVDMLWGGKVNKQRLGDRIARTLVIKA